MPAAMGGNIRPTFRTSIAPAIAKPGAPIDWVEWRVDEFMGAFLAPADKLARVLPKHASTLDLPFRWRAASGGLSVPFADLDPSEGALGLFVDDLAEAFGVTTALPPGGESVSFPPRVPPVGNQTLSIMAKMAIFFDKDC